MGGRGRSRARRLGGDVVGEVVYLQDVSAGEDAVDVRLQVLIHACAACSRVDLDPGGSGELVFGDEANGEQQRVAGNDALGSGDRGEVLSNVRDLDGLDAVSTDHARDGGG